jgi:hypothetical protein
MLNLTKVVSIKLRVLKINYLVGLSRYNLYWQSVITLNSVCIYENQVDSMFVIS